MDAPEEGGEEWTAEGWGGTRPMVSVWMGADTRQAELASSCGDSFEMQVAPAGIPVAAAVWVEWMELPQAAGLHRAVFLSLSPSEDSFSSSSKASLL